MSEIQARYADDSYLFLSPGKEAQIEMTRFRSGRDGALNAELEVRWNQTPLEGLLHHGTLNLLADRSLKTLSNLLDSRISDFDWFGFLTATTYRAKKRYREGDPPIRLADVEQRKARWLLRPLLEYEGPTVIAAPGGAMKSIMCLACALTVATGRTGVLGIKPTAIGAVLYLDWESDAQAHRNRLAAMCAHIGIEVPDNIYYRREYAGLYESSDELVRLVRELAIGMVVVDSKGMSIAGDPKEADVTVRLFQAVRRLEVPTIIVDHVTNEALKKGSDRPFGSVYTQNAARNVWMADVAESQPGEATVLWKNTKVNNGPPGTKLAWRIEFDMDEKGDFYEEIRVKPMSVFDVLAILGGEDTSLRGQIKRLLIKATSPQTVEEIAVELGASSSQVRARLNEGRDDNEFANVTQKGGRGKWLLAEKLTDRALPTPW